MPARISAYNNVSATSHALPHGTFLRLFALLGRQTAQRSCPRQYGHAPLARDEEQEERIGQAQAQKAQRQSYEWPVVVKSLGTFECWQRWLSSPPPQSAGGDWQVYVYCRAGTWAR